MRIITLAACLLLAQLTIATELSKEENIIRTYLSKAFEIRYDHADSALLYIHQANALANKQQLEESIQEIKLTQALVFSANKQDSAALKLLIASEEVIKNSTNEYQIHAYWAFAKAYFRIGLVDKGNLYFQKIIDECTPLPKEEIEILIDWASHNAKRGYYNEGLKIFEEAYEKSITYGLEADQVDISRYLSNVYGRKKDFQKAKEYAKKSVSYYLDLADPVKLGDSYLSLAGTFYQATDYDSSLYYYKVAEDIYQQAHNDLGLAYADINISEVLLAQHKQDSVLYYLNRAKEFADSAGASSRLMTYIDLKLVGYFIAEEAWDVSSQFLEGLEKNAKNSGDLEMLKETYHDFYTIYDHLNNDGRALEYFKLYHAYSDSINNATTEREYAKLRFAVDALEKENEIKTLNYKVERANNQRLIIVVVAVLLSAILLLIALVYRSRSLNTRLRLKNTLLEKKGVQEQLNIKEKELTDQTISMIQKNRFLEELSETLREAKTSLNGDPVRVINKSIQAIIRNKTNEKDWDNFNKYFGSVHHDFFENLKKKYPNMSTGDLRHCALVKMNLSTKESAELLGVSPQSIKMARYRAKKKMGLMEEESLGQHLLQV